MRWSRPAGLNPKYRKRREMVCRTKSVRGYQILDRRLLI